MEHHKGLLKSYIIGFILSVILTLCAYIPVAFYVSSKHTIFFHEIIIWIIFILAFVQLIVQLLFFLHMGQEAKPRWKLGVFISFFGIILIVVIASIWIMQHLNYNMSLIHFNNVMKYGEGF
ncbi:MAG TPA: cytochrome C oxidase subunit IV family protein [Candidatus Sulfotelmatobacter sp.]|jgi:cytochrome o ubiquinol oxidase operon protein cyoD|nr:cytochrome C oxidase subunit IV family protein [Candidatus Sulfotelmatobacter sp.]